ncbi:DedA family protein [Maricaulis maris]|uniref:Membrane protein DedA with SNARE-associated domain n=1 Tax=Maricaulis maris TaxID=74318 RepID=A0A495DKW2_9PROT|nr:VTT domain-containing protein [Maricaulis maris]RKR03222.1 membrane protein DedA with SNARE-associated domain [Maricaulis maris]
MDSSEPWLLASLFGGAFLDSLPGPCLFVFGEVFFVLAGTLLHDTGSLWPVVAVFAGALSADQIGYVLGARVAAPLRRLVLATARRRAAYRRAQRGLQRRTLVFVAISRLLGPVAWITPALAGSLRISRLRFSLGSLIGVFVGVGQFVLYGWLLAAGAVAAGVNLGGFLADHAGLMLLVGNAVVLVGLVSWRWSASRRARLQ